MMKKNLLQLTAISAFAISASSLSATTYYSTITEASPTSGSAWNTQADGLGDSATSTSHSSGTNNFVLQTGHTQRMPTNSGDSFWDTDASGVTMQTGSVFIVNRGPGYTANFAGGDIFVEGTATMESKQDAADATSLAFRLAGTSKIQLGSNTLNFDADGTGIHRFGLNVVGDGTIDFVFSDVTATTVLEDLSSDFTGRILADTMNGVLQFGAGNGAINADVRIGRTAGDRFGKLDIVGAFSVGELRFDNISVANGVYTASDLIAAYGNAADNILDNGGTVYVGQTIPEPSTYAMIAGALALMSVMVRRRR